jgi:hypothetical protein
LRRCQSSISIGCCFSVQRPLSHRTDANYAKSYPAPNLCMLTGQDLFGLFSHITFLFGGTPQKNWFHWTDYKLSSNMIERFAGQHIDFISLGPMTAMMKNWVRTISWIAWVLFAQCPVSATWQGWFPCTYSYPQQSQVLTMLPDWIEKLMLLPSPIPIPQTQAQLR